MRSPYLDPVFHTSDQPEALVIIKVSKVTGSMPNTAIGLKDLGFSVGRRVIDIPGLTCGPETQISPISPCLTRYGTKPVLVRIWQLFGQVHELHRGALSQLPSHITVAFDGHRVLHRGVGHRLSFG